MWFLYEYEKGRLTLNAPTRAAMKKPAPLEDYVKPQGRFKGVDVEGLQKEINASVERIKELAAMETVEKAKEASR
jgi:pyruvate ferredoxin oxidoreductase beta subunit